MSYYEQIKDRQKKAQDALKNMGIADGEVLALVSINANLILIAQTLAIIADALTTEEEADEHQDD